MADKQYALDRLRRVQKSLTGTVTGLANAAVNSDFITVTGPCDQVNIDFRLTSDAFTVDTLGLWAGVRRLQILSNKRGRIGELTGIGIGIISRCIFNSAAPTGTAGGAALDGWTASLPIACDADEQLTFTYDWGSTADMCSTGDLGAAGYVAPVIRMQAKVIPQNPSTYWAYFSQALGAAGVLGASATVQQPQIPTIPGFSLVGEGTVSMVTSATTALTNAISEQRVVKGSDYIVDDFVRLLRRQAGCRIYNELATGYSIMRHVPLEVTGDTLFVNVNGATATIAQSEAVYIYQSGLLSAPKGDQSVSQSPPQVPGGSQGGGVTTGPSGSPPPPTGGGQTGVASGGFGGFGGFFRR